MHGSFVHNPVGPARVPQTACSPKTTLLRSYASAVTAIESSQNHNPANPFPRRLAKVTVWVALFWSDRQGRRVNIFPEQNVGPSARLGRQSCPWSFVWAAPPFRVELSHRESYLADG
jgi:hypothetical protein